MASPALDFARENQQRFVNELKDLLRIPSVSEQSVALLWCRVC